MIFDLRKDSPDTDTIFDAIVVGTGPAGAVLVNELLRKDKKLNICVLESGREAPSEYSDELRRVFSSDFVIKANSRERVLGGTSTTWAGLSAPLDDIDMSNRPWFEVPGWPIDRKELSSYYAAAASRYRFPDPELYSLDYGRSRVSGNWASLKDDGDIRFDWRDISEKLFLASVPAQNFGKEFRGVYEEVDVSLFLDATVKQLKSSVVDGMSIATAAVVRNSANIEYEFRARKFVICAGGLENARILLNSPSTKGYALGNKHDIVGRYMMNHPKRYHGTIKLRTPVFYLPYYFGCMWGPYSGYCGFRLSDAVQRASEITNCCVRVEPDLPWSDSKGVEQFILLAGRAQALLNLWRRSRRNKVMEMRNTAEAGESSEGETTVRWTFEMVIRMLRDTPNILRYLWYRIFRRPSVDRMKICNFIEMEPRFDNRVSLSKQVDIHGYPLARVDYRTSPLDVKSLTQLVRVFAQELRSGNVGELESEVLEGMEASVSIDLDASHHMGTTRMGDDPKSSVVSANCLVHGTTNLFLSGASTFSTSGCANPTLTVVALSIRLANTLYDELVEDG